MLLKYRTVCRFVALLLLSFTAISADSSETYFPADVKICSTKDPNYHTCFTDSANRMLKHLVQGLSKLNFVPIDPLNVPVISLEMNNSFIPTLGFRYTDVIYEGWKDAVVLRSKINPSDHEFNLVIKIPRYQMRSPYEITGSIVGIPMEGSGNATMTFSNVINDMQMRGHLEESNGQEFLVIDDFSQKTDVDKVEFDFSNLFNNAKQTEITNKLLNLSNRAILDIGNDFLNYLWGKIHAELVQKIFDKVPYRVMFPDLNSANEALEDQNEDKGEL